MGSLRHPKMNLKHFILVGSVNTCPLGVQHSDGVANKGVAGQDVTAGVVVMVAQPATLARRVSIIKGPAKPNGLPHLG